MAEEEAGIERLPEGCISTILSLTSPADACRAASVSTAFGSASSSDLVWDKFLPSDHPSLPIHYSSKKEAYFHLCDHPILINNGDMSFQLERSSGAKRYMLSARSLTIIWGSTPEYWRWIQVPNSRFAEVAELANVCWLEIRGKIESKLLTEKTTYIAYLIFRLDNGFCGFHNPPQKTCVKVGGQSSQLMVRLQPRKPNRPSRLWRGSLIRRGHTLQEEVELGIEEPRERDDQWMEVELGEFYNDTGEDGEVDISFMEVKGGQWKRGLTVQGIEIRPKKSA